MSSKTTCISTTKIDRDSLEHGEKANTGSYRTCIVIFLTLCRNNRRLCGRVTLIHDDDMMDYFSLKWSLTSALFVTLLSLVQCDTTNCTHMEPSGTQYIPVGEQLELICSYSGEDMNNSSDSLSIRHCMDLKCFTLSSEPVNSSSIRTVIPSLQGENNHTYYCSFQNNHETISMTYVRVGYRPSTPEDIYCFSRNHCDMNCNVKLAERDAKSRLWLNVTFEFQSSWSTEWLNCPVPGNHYCYWSPPSGSGVDMDNDFGINRHYTIKATVTNVLGSNQRTRYIEDTRTIVKISELHQFKVTNITRREVLLTWMLPESLLVTFVIDFVIIYESKWAKQKVLHSSKNSTSTSLTKLIPYTQYNVSIRARSQLVEDERNWSAFSRLLFKTEKDAPDAAPRTTVGGYFIPRRWNNLTELNCALQIFIKPMPPKKRNGELSDLYYKVYLKGDPSHNYIVNPAATIALSHASCWNKGPYDIVLRACNGEHLCSNKRALMPIPLVDQDSNIEFPRATDVIAEGFGEAKFRVSWTISPNFDESLVRGVTVFWCRGSREQHLCKNKMSWQKIEKPVTSADLQIKHSNYRDWMFAVAYITNDDKSSGMVFEECQFLYDESKSNKATDSAVKPTFQLLTRDDQEGKSVNVVSLSFRYCDAQFLYRKPEQYELFYKQTQGSTEEDCISGARSLNVTATLRVKEIVLPDLDPMSLYSVCMRIRTSIGISKLSDIQWRKPIKSPAGTFLDTAEIVLIIIGSLLGLAFVVLMIRCFKRYHKGLDTHIEVPAIGQDYQVTTVNQKTSADSYADSGFNSRGNVTNTTDERMRHYRKLSFPTASERSEDRDGLLGEEEKLVSDVTNQGPGASYYTKTRLKNADKITGSGLSDYCQTDRKPEMNNCGSSISTEHTSDCSLVKRIPSSESDIDIEDNGHTTFVEVSDPNIAPLLVPMDANSAVMVNGRGVNYKPQLDTRPGIPTGDIQTDGSNDSDGSLNDLESDSSFERIQNMTVYYGQNGKSPNIVKSNRYNKRCQDNLGDAHLQSKGDNSKRILMSPDTLLGASSTNTYSCLKVDNCEEEHSLDHSILRNTCRDTSILGREPYRMYPVTKAASQTCRPATRYQSNGYNSLDPGTCELNTDNSGTCCEPHQHYIGSCCEQNEDLSCTQRELNNDNCGTVWEKHKHYSDTSCEQPGENCCSYCEQRKHYSDTSCEQPGDNCGSCCEQRKHYSDTSCEQPGDNCGSCCEQRKGQLEPISFDDNNSLFEPLNPDTNFKSENIASVRKKTYVARIC